MLLWTLESRSYTFVFHCVCHTWHNSWNAIKHHQFCQYYCTLAFFGRSIQSTCFSRPFMFFFPVIFASLCSSRFRTSERKAGERRSTPGLSQKNWAAYFATLSQFPSRSRAFGKGKETAATQARFLPTICCRAEKIKFTLDDSNTESSKI